MAQILVVEDVNRSLPTQKKKKVPIIKESKDTSIHSSRMRVNW